MPIVMIMHWAECTPEQYEEARRAVGWEVDQPEGGLHHTSWFEDDGMHVVDVWESAEQFRRFADARLMPVVKGELGIPGDPDVKIVPAHATFVAEAAQALAGSR
jgi:hypothetical protein